MLIWMRLSASRMGVKTAASNRSAVLPDCVLAIPPTNCRCQLSDVGEHRDVRDDRVWLLSKIESRGPHFAGNGGVHAKSSKGDALQYEFTALAISEVRPGAIGDCRQ
jgi:hypothetical protein